MSYFVSGQLSTRVKERTINTRLGLRRTRVVAYSQNDLCHFWCPFTVYVVLVSKRLPNRIAKSATFSQMRSERSVDKVFSVILYPAANWLQRM